MNPYTTLSDAELFALLQKEDWNAFAQVYDRYWTPLLIYANGFTKDEDASKDVVQDVFQMLLEKGATLKVHTSLSSLLYTSVRFKILKQFRHSKVVDKYLATLEDLIDGGVDSTELAMEEKELTKRIQRGLDQLPPKMREVFELSRMQEFSHRQISEKLGIADHTVKKQINRALKIIRKALGKSLFFWL